MIVRKIAARGRPRTGASDPRPPKRNRAWLFLFLTLGAGAASGIVALVGPGLVTDVGAAITTHVAATTNQPIQASTLPRGRPAQGDRRLRSAATKTCGSAGATRAQPKPVAAPVPAADAIRIPEADALRVATPGQLRWS